MIRLRWISSRPNWTAAAALADATSGRLDRTEDFALVAQQHDAPAALHPTGELGGAVFLAGAAGHSGNYSPYPAPDRRTPIWLTTPTPLTAGTMRPART